MVQTIRANMAPRSPQLSHSQNALVVLSGAPSFEPTYARLPTFAAMIALLTGLATANRVSRARGDPKPAVDSTEKLTRTAFAGG
jgi:hypothetical protein